MKKDLTEIVFILDRSGSMAGLEDDTVGGFNSMLEKQKKEAGEALISTILFDHEQKVLHDRADVKTVSPLTRNDYIVRGSTALLDAVGNAIRHVDLVHKYIRKEDVPEKTMFIITTDGMENASRSFTRAQIREMIEAHKKQKGWEFLFMGANINAEETAESIGIGAERAVTFINDKLGTALNYEVLSDTLSCMRSSPTRAVPADWKKRIENRS